MKIGSPQLKVILQSHGFVGNCSSSPPRTEELKKQLNEMITKGIVGQGAQASLITDVEAWALEEDMASWGNMLPDSLQRAAPEIYRNLVGGAGRKSVRDVIDDYFPLASRSASTDYLELFNIATAVDFLAERHKHSSLLLMQALATDDTAEIGLRRISSWLHEKRTGDKAAARSMLAIQPRGQFGNAAPQWLLEQAQAFSTQEYKTAERVRHGKSSARAPDGGRGKKGKGKGKKGDKGKKHGDGADAGAARPTQG